MTRGQRVFATATVAVVLLDQASKAWIVHALRPDTDELTLIPGLLSLIHARNDAAAFGMMSDVPNRRWIFLAFTAVAVPLVAWLVSRLPPAATRSAAALGLMAGGALGNAIDRARE